MACCWRPAQRPTKGGRELSTQRKIRSLTEGNVALIEAAQNSSYTRRAATCMSGELLLVRPSICISSSVFIRLQGPIRSVVLPTRVRVSLSYELLGVGWSLVHSCNSVCDPGPPVTIFPIQKRELNTLASHCPAGNGHAPTRFVLPPTTTSLPQQYS